MKNKSKNLKKGFTLVEVIVVAVIVAILAAVAIPIYQGYVEDSNRDQASNTAGSIASYCGACVAKGGTCPTADVAANANVTCTGATAGASTAVILIPEGSTATFTDAASVHVCRGTGICSEEYYWAAAPVAP